MSDGERPFNPLPWALAAVALGFGVMIAAQNSWIGQVMNRGPVQEDPMRTMPVQTARQTIEQQLNANLAAVGAKGKITWMSGEKTVDITFPESVELTIDTSLRDPQQRRSVVDPVKQYMYPGKISTITMNDSRSHATWTYSMAPMLGDDKPEVEDKSDQSN
ncbi:MAG: hypothetical protein C5B53_07005 [Candidatus Melainabacteria bacterium]|nr:MAG: hypothetical protein C5B53_07005 [Candidatus Melainabacteria bacterium]